MVKDLPAMWETEFNPWVGKIPWRREWLLTQVFLPGKFHEQRSLVGYGTSLVAQMVKNLPPMQEVWV